MDEEGTFDFKPIEGPKRSKDYTSQFVENFELSKDFSKPSRPYISKFKENFELSKEYPKTRRLRTSRVKDRSDRLMAEPRARAARHKGQLNFGPEIASLLHAFGDVPEPLEETVRVLDEITTDFLIETCHDAAKTAAAAGRQKVKVEDFKFAIRGDALMLGRVNELLALDRELKDARRQFDTEEGRIGLERGRKKKADKDADKEVEKDVDMEVEAVPEAETGPS